MKKSSHPSPKKSEIEYLIFQLRNYTRGLM